MPYFLRNMHLTLPQVKALSSGGSVRVPHNHLLGHHAVYLTKSQHEAMSKAHHLGKGVSLKMSQTQVHHNAKKGGNIFSTIYKGLKHFVGRPATREALVNLIKNPSQFAEVPKKVVGALLRRGVNHVANRYAPGSGAYAESLADRGLKKFGMGARKKRLGKGFFDSVGNFFSKPSNVLGGIGTIARFTPLSALSGPLAVASLGTKLAGHGFKRKKRKVLKRRAGGSFLL